MLHMRRDDMHLLMQFVTVMSWKRRQCSVRRSHVPVVYLRLCMSHSLKQLQHAAMIRSMRHRI